MSRPSNLPPPPLRPDGADAPSNFIRDIVADDLAARKHGGRVATRFPPEPNGYLHIGHAKSICLNFGLAEEFGGQCHLRFDDSNPTGESVEFVEAIQRDVRWLGFDWGENLFFASDYFERLYAFAVELIEAGKAYVCSLNEEQIRDYRGTVTEPGRPSPYRDRSVEENLDLFRRMRAGEFPDGAHVLRAKIDMAAANMKMRDPLLYRIRHVPHYRTGDRWCIYPLYDFIHPLSDALEDITHSICTLEFENNRELYDWVVGSVKTPGRPRQYEFARLNLSYTVLSKRKLIQLVNERHVSGWDDPRMPTLAGLRRRGYTPEAIREFCDRIGVAKNNSTVDVALLEHTLREDLNHRSPRHLAVLRPLRVLIDNYPEGQVEELEAPLWPHDVPKQGSRKLPFSRELYIEQDDFLLEPPKGYHRLSPGAEVRLRYAYVIRCDDVVRDAAGNVVELRCSYDPETRGGDAAGKKVKGTIHWVSAPHSVEAEVRLYDRLFKSEFPGSESDFLDDINPGSLVALRARVEPALAKAAADERFQFERHGYFYVDPVDSRPGTPVFNRTVALKDTWAKLSKGAAPGTEKERPASAPGAAAARTPGAPKPAPLPPAALALRDRHGLGDDEARVLADQAPLRALFDDAARHTTNARAAASWIVNELAPELRDRGAGGSAVSGRSVAELVQLIDDGTISGAIGKQVLAEMLKTGDGAGAIVERRGLRQIDDRAALEPVVDQVLASDPEAVARYRAGNKNVLGAFVGMVMKQTRGKANPKLVNELLRRRLE
ncbi:MAG TPA: glutamine--tRNA ligase/YqeY domain fusion protein [Polyangiaceae bacterium]|nr:glutamine--tRNA ligase/YqeY domain fusion protein [Polyangiaceae bacterium]